MISIGRLKPARHDSSLVSDHLSSSQLPVWTIYGEKICVRTVSDLECPTSWAFEMVTLCESETLVTHQAGPKCRAQPKIVKTGHFSSSTEQ